MALTRWRPYSGFNSSIREPWHLFDQEYWDRNYDNGGTKVQNQSGDFVFTPHADIHEDDSNVFLTVELPGLSQEAVKINLDGDTLTVSGDRPFPEYDDCRCSEGTYGKFRRSFSIGKSVDREGIQAGMKNGVLSITLPKSEETKPRQIEITG